MSYVTNILLTAGVDEPGVAELNSALESLEGEGCVLNRVDLASGGRKAVEAEVWLGAFNYLDLEAALRAVASVAWSHPEEVQVFVKDENDDRFADRTPNLADGARR